MAATLYGACALITNKIMRKSSGENDTGMKLYEIEKKIRRRRKCRGVKARVRRRKSNSYIVPSPLNLCASPSLLRFFAFKTLHVSPLHLCIFAQREKCKVASGSNGTTIGHSK